MTPDTRNHQLVLILLWLRSWNKHDSEFTLSFLHLKTQIRIYIIRVNTTIFNNTIIYHHNLPYH